MKKIPYIRIAQWLIILVACIPLVVVPAIPLQYLIPKIFLFRTLVVLSFLTLVVGVLVKADIRISTYQRLRDFSREKIAWAIGGLLIVLCVSTALAVDSSLALWGALTRQEGLIGYVFIFVGAVLLYVLFDQRAWRRFMQISVAVSGILFAYQLVQFVDHINRPSSFVGNPIFLATYYLFSALFASFLYLEKRADTPRLLSRLYLGAVCTSGVGILFASSRGVLVGIIAAAVIIAVREFRTHPAFKKVLGIALAFVLLFVLTHRMPLWQHIPGFDRLATTSLSAGTARSRIIVGQMSLSSLTDTSVPLKHKLLGWGWDNFVFMWQKEYRPELFAFDSGLFDRAHNELIDQLIMNGIVGVCVYLFFWYAVFKKALSLRKKNARISALFLAIFISYFVQNIFVFDTAFTILFLFVTCMYLLFYERSLSAREQAPPSASVLWQKKVYVGVLCVILIVLSYGYYRSVILSSHQIVVFTQGGKRLERGLVPNASFEKTLSATGSASIEFRDAVLFKFFEPNPAIPLNEVTFPVFQQQIVGMEAYLQSRPVQYQYLLDLAKGYVMQGEITHNLSDLLRAQNTFEKALLLSPKRQDTVCEYALVLQKYDRGPEALALIQESLAPYADVPDTRYCAAHVQSALGVEYYDGALVDAEYALSHGFTPEPATLTMYKLFARYYYEKHDLEHMVTVLTRMKTLDPSQMKTCEAILAYIAQYHMLPTIVLQ